MSSLFSPDEQVILSGKGQLEQPIQGHGEIYLTDKRIFLVHKSGLIRKRETPLLDAAVSEITYAKAEGMVRKVLVFGVRASGGQVLAYKVRVPDPQSWVAQIYNLKGGSKASTPRIASTSPTAQVTRYCIQCGGQITSEAKFCSKCGSSQQ